MMESARALLVGLVWNR